MKNSKNHRTGHYQIRFDALLLAALILIQSIFPTALLATEVSTKAHHNAIQKAVTTPVGLNKPPATTYRLTEELEKAPKVEPVIAPGGPDQPEVQSFTPVSAENMVNPFTGDFSYNLPLMDVDGYPINLSYNAGVGMAQEATWVGLGWNLNPGVINRQMRGIPDDFNGIDKVTQEYNQKPNWTVGTSVGANYEVYAITIPNSNNSNDTIGGVSISAKLGVEYNNYMGYASDFSTGPSFNIAKKVGLDVGLQLTGSSQGGASIGTYASLFDGTKKGDNVSNKLTVSSSFNSRQGLQQVSVNLSQERMVASSNKQVREGRSVGRENIGGSIGASFNFGQSSFVPQIPFETNANSFTARFKLGGDIFGNDVTGTFTGFFSKSTLASNSKTLSAYGYSNLEKGQFNEFGMLDFNRENNSSFTRNTPALPVPHLMYDILTVSGQDVSGSYRMDRQDIGYVFDPRISSSSNSYTLGGEVGLGATFKAGIDVGAVFTNASSGAWTDGNDAARNVRFKSSNNFYRDASELAYDESDTEFQNIGGSKAVYFPLANEKQLSNSLRTSTGETFYLNNAKSLKFRRNQPLTSFTVKEIRDGYGPTKLPSSAFANTQNLISHHAGAFTVTKLDGSRYYYGLPAYSHMQKNVSFAVGDGNSSGLTPDWNTRLVSYSQQDASTANNRGLDNHFNAQTFPPYAHSYMLTAVLDKDYVDSDNIPGPSKGDLGNYVEFKYKQVQTYKWRNPVNASQAFHDRGLNTDPTDDKASYIYGEKELWYLDTIKGKNHLVIFYTSKRKDAVSVNDENGGMNGTNASMLQLDSLKLYTIPEFQANGANAKALKTAHFKYDYSLCPGYIGNVDQSDFSQSGKLTLKSVYFTYQDSYRGEKALFEFNYDNNPPYNPNSVDRWGTYKPNPTGLTGDEKTDPLTNSDFPYVGYDKALADGYAGAWNLNRIKLPSGATIEVLYEADDYAFVQHKRAKQMFKIMAVEGCSDSKCSISNDDNKNRKLYFEMIPGTTVDQYAEVGNTIYFRALMSMDEDADHFDYVPGYAVIDEIGTDGSYGYVKLKPGKLKDSEAASYNPIAVAGVQYARNYLARMIPPSSQANPQQEGANFLDIVNSLVGAFTSFQELFTGPNKPIWNNEIGTIMITGKSWLRLNNPNYSKLGGGHRVREIRTYDNWDLMAVHEDASYYGQQFEYNFDGRSSGVATYEPQLGGEENVWRDYVANDISMTWAPDIRNYMETPFGEQFFPTPMVGYGKVLIKNLQREGVKRTATGHTVNEFYTTRDFPTNAERTIVDKKPRRFNLNLLLYAKSEDMMAASQGFVVEGNDMNGKPKSAEVFAEGQVAPYSSVKYYYQSAPKVIEGISANTLDNTVNVITPAGTVKSAVVGRTYEAVADFRESKSKMKSGNLGINLNYTMPFLLVPMILGANYTDSKTEFRSAAFTKTIERRGILQRTVTESNNSRVETENLAYDAETGDVLLTSANNNYRDTIYTFTYPAHWIYPRMGQAYRNLGFTSKSNKVFTDGYCSGFTSANLFPGDEVMIVKAGNLLRGWVTESTADAVRILFKDGTPVDGTISYLKVLRSGNRNLQASPVGSVTLKRNPLATLSANVLAEVLTAEGMEYGDAWRTFCDCSSPANSNPYVIGLKGNWNPKASYQYLSGRSQSFENNNSNVRRDGTLTSFSPFFKLDNGRWFLDKQQWTNTTEVYDFSPAGQPLETLDAIGHHAVEQFGYNQTLSTVSASNAMLRQIGYNGFEDYGFGSCMDAHFKFGTSGNLTTSDAHTGKYAITVTPGHDVVLQKQLVALCEAEDPCDFSKYVSDEHPIKINVMDIDGINMSYETIYGDPVPDMQEIPGGILLSFSSAEPFRVEVTLTKSNGCSTIVPIIGNGN